MKSTLYTYSQVLEKVKPKLLDLKKKRELKEFCRTYELNYKLIAHLSSESNTKQYPDALIKLIKIFNHKKVERVKAFRIFDD